MNGLVIIIGIAALISFIPAIMAGKVAKEKGYSENLWGLGAWLFTIPVWILVAGLPDKKKAVIERKKLDDVIFELRQLRLKDEKL